MVDPSAVVVQNAAVDQSAAIQNVTGAALNEAVRGEVLVGAQVAAIQDAVRVVAPVAVRAEVLNAAVVLDAVTRCVQAAVSLCVRAAATRCAQASVNLCGRAAVSLSVMGVQDEAPRVDLRDDQGVVPVAHLVLDVVHSVAAIAGDRDVARSRSAPPVRDAQLRRLVVLRFAAIRQCWVTAVTILVSVLVHERRVNVSDLRRAPNLASVRRRQSDDSEYHDSDFCDPDDLRCRHRVHVRPDYSRRHHCDAEDLPSPDRDRSLGVRSFPQRSVHDVLDGRILRAASASRHAMVHHHADLFVRLVRRIQADRDDYRVHHGDRDDSDANAGLSGSTTADTNKRRCRMKCRLRTRRVRDATNCDGACKWCVDTRPSNRCETPSDRSGTGPNPTVRSQPMSSHKADTTTNGRNDMAPSR